MADQDFLRSSGKGLDLCLGMSHGQDMSTPTIIPGMSVVITDADGIDHEVEALSAVETKGHAFPLVWVNRPLVSGEFEPIPWPADHVRTVVL